MTGGDHEVSVLETKREATRYRILVEIAERQPAVSQREIAESIGVTAQAVSDYLRELIEEGYVHKRGRGRYEVTKEGVDWLISRTDDLREFLAHVTEDVIGEVEVEAAIATAGITEGQRVSLSMREGVLHATPGTAGSATAVAVIDAAAGEAVGVTDFEGIVEYDPGTVTVVSIPRVEDAAEPPDTDAIREAAGDHDLLAAAGTEALVAVRAAGLDPDVRFGTAPAVREAATKGLDALLLVVESAMGEHTSALREGSVSYEVVDLGEADL
ncbi:MAG: winged helix-turn-helix transcriptional regulator [Halobacteriales archaeon]